MNILDKAIAAVSPAWAARRVAHRVALTDLRAYEAAKRDRNTEGWQVTGGSAGRGGCASLGKQLPSTGGPWKRQVFSPSSWTMIRLSAS